MNNYGSKAPITGSTRYLKTKKDGKSHPNLPQQVTGPAKCEAERQTQLVPPTTATTPEAVNMALQSPQTPFLTPTAQNPDDDVMASATHVTDSLPSCSGIKPLSEAVKQMLDNDSNANSDSEEEDEGLITTRVYKPQDKMDFAEIEFAKNDNARKKRKIANLTPDNTPPGPGHTPVPTQNRYEVLTDLPQENTGLKKGKTTTTGAIHIVWTSNYH